jgi:hypothetical protein
MSKRSLLAAVFCALVFAAVSAGTAFAGEVTGNGKQTPIGAAPDSDPHASSICSFSGQNDNPNEPGAGGRVQSWGQNVSNAVHAGAAPPGGVPGQACNGHSGAFSG